MDERIGKLKLDKDALMDRTFYLKVLGIALVSAIFNFVIFRYFDNPIVLNIIYSTAFTAMLSGFLEYGKSSVR